MTDSSKLFRRPRGEGWLVLTDRPPVLGGEYANLANSLLLHADLSYQPVCILGDDVKYPTLPEFITDLQTLLDIEIAVERLEDVKGWDTLDPGILVLAGGRAEDWVRTLEETNLGVLILQGFMDGSLLIAIDTAAAALGSWVLEEGSDSPFPGLSWLVGSVVLPWIVDPAELEIVRSVLARTEPLYAIGLAGGRVIALGPGGEVELWGVDAPTIVLGSGWRK